MNGQTELRGFVSEFVITAPSPFPHTQTHLEFSLEVSLQGRGDDDSYCQINKLGGAGDKFGGHLCVDCADFLYISVYNQFTNTKFT